MVRQLLHQKGNYHSTAIVRSGMKVEDGDKLEFISCDGQYRVIAVTREVKTLKGF
jgi:hypothetical protein